LQSRGFKKFLKQYRISRGKYGSIVCSAFPRFIQNDFFIDFCVDYDTVKQLWNKSSSVLEGTYL